MPIAVFKCPNVGCQVQASFPELPEDATAVYQSVQCIACDRTHMVNIKTGQLFGEDEAAGDKGKPSE
jgi:hypothetical protein